jgi:hypothetical protein
VKVEDYTVRDAIRGPVNSLRRDRPELLRPFTVNIDPENDAAVINIGDDAFLMQAGEWSPWVRVAFDLVGPVKHGPSRLPH